MAVVGVPCFDSSANQNTRQHQNQYLELQDLFLLFSERDLSNVCLQRFILCALSIGFILVIKCRCLIFCLVGLTHQNMKCLGKIYRMEKHLVHWEMDSRRGHNILINGYGISEGKSNLAARSFGYGMRWTSMIWKENFNSQTKGILNHNLNNKELFDRQG